MFAPARFKNRNSKSVAPLRYAIRKSGMSQTRCCIQIIVDPELAAKAGIKADEGVRLDFDPERNLGRLVAIERSPRAFRNTSRLTALIGSWPWNSDIEKHLPRSTDPDTDIVPLVVSDVSKSEGLIFELPRHEKE